MPEQRDQWSKWLLNRRFGGSAERMQAALDFLYPVRDKVLQNARLDDNETLLDVGCGDGLIGFGALAQSATVNVVFSDISQDLLTHAEKLAQEMGVVDRCRFVCASAENLAEIEGESADVVTIRSVLIYVADKTQAFREFYRVLKPSGCLSIFEPINSFRYPEPDHIFAGYDVTPVIEIAQKIKAVYHRLQPPHSDPMLDFDERDLLTLAERAGFREIQLELQVEIKPKSQNISWETLLQVAGNPKIPNLAEAMANALTPAEQQAFETHLRPLVENRQGVNQRALAYLWATK